MTGIISPFSDAPRKHYPGGGPAATFAIELAQYANCPAGNSVKDKGMMMSCLREVTAEKLINASISLYEEKYKNQVNMLLAVLLKIFNAFYKALGIWLQASFTRTVRVTSVGTIQKWVRCSPVVLITHNIKKRSKVLLPKAVILTVCVNEPSEALRVSPLQISVLHINFVKLICNWFCGKGKKRVNWSDSKTVSLSMNQYLWLLAFTQLKFECFDF